MWISVLAIIGLFTPLLLWESANAETRKLKLYFLHTGEKATITYKKNGGFVPAGLKKVNYFLRDWRRNEPTKMDPELLDLIWEVYRKSGSRGYVHVISGYRSPATNNMLRKRSRGVAKNSQHTLGKALDFFLPDVKLAKLRKIGLIKQYGGVGYYPRSGSPFVHMDTGRVRHWPRMSRKELVRVFPNGKTLHVPSDGKPLRGYKQAVASYNSRKSSSKKIVLATGNDEKRKNNYKRLASRDTDDEDDRASNYIPGPRKVKTTSKSKFRIFAKRTPDNAANPTSKPGFALASARNSISDSENSTSSPGLSDENSPNSGLPLMANIPVPSIAPRDLAPQRQTVIASTTSDNVIFAMLKSKDPIGTLSAASGLSNYPKQDFSASDNQASAINLMSANGKQPQTDLPGAMVPASDFDNNPTEPSDFITASIADRQIRDHLVMQTNDQLRARFAAPPRPNVELGSSFETALLAPQNSVSTRINRVLTRSLASAGQVNTFRRDDIAAVDKSWNSFGAIPLPMANPDRFATQQMPITKLPVVVPVNDENLTGNGQLGLAGEKTEQPVKLEPIDSDMKNNGSIALPQQNPILVAALSNSSSGHSETESTVPARRPQLIAASSQTARSASYTLSLVEEDTENLASMDNLRALINKQSREMTGVNAENDPARPAIQSIAPMMLAAIPTISPRRAIIAQPHKTTSDDFASQGYPIVLAGFEKYDDRYDAATLTSAPSPLDDLSLGWYEQRRAGKFVLASSLTLTAADELRAPAYGRAAIRQSPKAVLTAGFIRSASIQNSSRFTGQAIHFQNFSNFN
jgi:uncharacterized protein YcbK (DUF882 family)